MKKTRVRNIIKLLAFLAILAGIFLFTVNLNPMKVSGGGRSAWEGFYSEKKNGLDVVYVGASNVYYFWSAPYAWDRFGLTAYPLATPKMPPIAEKYVIMEARKTQPDAMYVICLNNFKTSDSVTVDAAHWTTDYMHLNATKVKLVNDMYEIVEDETVTKAELLFPLLRFHTKWSVLKENDFIENVKLKGAYIGGNNSALKRFYFERSKNISGAVQITEETQELYPEQEELLSDLLNYLTDNQVNTLFVIVPQALPSETDFKQLNKLARECEAKGFPVLNMLTNGGMSIFNLKKDYTDTKHVNIHGCLKFTHYLAEYLQLNYGFSDKRGEKAYSDWDQAYEEYLEIIAPHTLDFERDLLPRDLKVKTPKLTKCRAQGTTLSLTWEVSEKAEYYYIYRKQNITGNTDQTAWERIAQVEGDADSYKDSGLELNVKYFYTVVPVKTKDKTEYFGDFDYEGISATTILDAPELTSIEKTDEGNTIRWNPIESADGYTIYRKEKSSSFKVIDTVSAEESSYTDDHVLDDVEYMYSVGAYQDTDGERTEGYYSRKGLSAS